MKILLTALALALVTTAAHAQLFVTTFFGPRIGAYNPVTGATINANLVTGLTNTDALTAAGGALYVANSSPAASIGKYALDGTPIAVPFLGFRSDILVSGTDLFAFPFANTLGKYTTAGVTVNQLFITTLNDPRSVVRAGNTLYIANAGSNSVGTYQADTGTVINASFITGLNEPTALAIFGNTLYVCNFATDTVGSYNATTGAAFNAALIPGLNDPVDIKVFGGFLYVANRNAGTVGKYNLDGTVVNAALVSGVAPSGIAVAFDKSTAIDLGVISSTNADYPTPDRTTSVTISAARQVVWYKFTIAENADAVSTRFLDISTRPDSLFALPNNDTEIGIYNSDGVRLADNDDGGVRVSGNLNSAGYSQLSFGSAAPARGPLTAPGFAGASASATGQNGPLPSGTYYLAVSVYDTTFLDADFDVAGTGANTGTFNVDFRTDIPAATIPNRAPTLRVVASSIRPTSKSSVTIRGTCADVDGSVPSVLVKVGRAKFQRARGDLRWTFAAKLKVGRNPVQIYAIDNDGLRSPLRRVTITRRR